MIQGLDYLIIIICLFIEKVVQKRQDKITRNKIDKNRNIRMKWGDINGSIES